MSHTDVGNSCASLFFSSHFHYTQPARSITPPNMTMSVPHLRDDEEFIDGLSWGVLKKFVTMSGLHIGPEFATANMLRMAFQMLAQDISSPIPLDHHHQNLKIPERRISLLVDRVYAEMQTPAAAGVLWIVVHNLLS
jgi:hypothetical protein